MKKLQALCNEDANKIIKETTQYKNANEKLNFFINLDLVTSDTKSVPEEPTIFAKAWNHPQQILTKNGKKPLVKSLLMNKQQVWHKTGKILMPPTWGCVKNKLVFKIKHNRPTFF